MLILSTKGRYGTRLMLYLAIQKRDELVLLKDIAKNEEISKGYLEQLVPLLKAAGLIHSTRGAHGGYRLGKKAEDITLKDILEALEGPVTPTECVMNSASCTRSDCCVPREVWSDLKGKIEDAFESVTLQQMIDLREKNSVGNGLSNYQI